MVDAKLKKQMSNLEEFNLFRPPLYMKIRGAFTNSCTLRFCPTNSRLSTRDNHKSITLQNHCITYHNRFFPSLAYRPCYAPASHLKRGRSSWINLGVYMTNNNCLSPFSLTYAYYNTMFIHGVNIFIFVKL
jgi:hypothetical protein